MEEVEMPKGTVHGGASHEAAGVLPAALTEEEIAAHTAPPQLGPAEIEEDEPADEPEPYAPIDYSKWLKADLVAEAELRALDPAGTAEVLRTRLAADDEAKREAGDEQPVS
jgi:hypothetical protein